MGNAQAGGMGGAPQGAGASGAGGVDTAHSYRDPDPSTFLPNGKPVYVNVYHLMPGGPMNNLNGAIAGLGAFHSGVQVGLDLEYAFGGDHPASERPGVFWHPPRQILPEHQFHRAHYVGNLPASCDPRAVMELAVTMGRGPWMARTYELMQRNCNHFAEEFVRELSTRFVEPAGGPPLVYPGYINRAAKMGTSFIPPQMRALFSNSAPKAPGATGDAAPPQAPPQASQPSSAPPPPPPQRQQQQQQQQPRPQQSQSRPTQPKPEPRASTASSAPAPPAVRTADELQRMPAKELRALAQAHGLDPRTLLEKQDFVDAILAKQRTSG